MQHTLIPNTYIGRYVIGRLYVLNSNEEESSSRSQTYDKSYQGRNFRLFMVAQYHVCCGYVLVKKIGMFDRSQEGDIFLANKNHS